MRLSLKVEGSWNLERGTWNVELERGTWNVEPGTRPPLHRPPQQARIGLGDLARPPLRTGDDVLGPSLGPDGSHPEKPALHIGRTGTYPGKVSQSGSDQKPGVIGQRPLVAATGFSDRQKALGLLLHLLVMQADGPAEFDPTDPRSR